MKHCKYMKNGYFFHDNSQKIKKCKEKGCASCHIEDVCVACKKKFYPIYNTENSEITTV